MQKIYQVYAEDIPRLVENKVDSSLAISSTFPLRSEY